MPRLIDADALCTDLLERWSVAETRKEELIKVVMADIVTPIIALQPTIQPELTDEQSIAHLQSSGWMQRHDKEMYESGLKEQLADDSDSYDSLLPTAQPEQCEWIPKEVENVPYGLLVECSKCGGSELVDNALYHKYCPNCGRKVITE